MNGVTMSHRRCLTIEDRQTSSFAAHFQHGDAQQTSTFALVSTRTNVSPLKLQTSAARSCSFDGALDITGKCRRTSALALLTTPHMPLNTPAEHPFTTTSFHPMRRNPRSGATVWDFVHVINIHNGT